MSPQVTRKNNVRSVVDPFPNRCYVLTHNFVDLQNYLRLARNPL